MATGGPREEEQVVPHEEDNGVRAVQARYLRSPSPSRSVCTQPHTQYSRLQSTRSPLSPGHGSSKEQLGTQSVVVRPGVRMTGGGIWGNMEWFTKRNG